jgi:hypothetical protein
MAETGVFVGVTKESPSRSPFSKEGYRGIFALVATEPGAGSPLSILGEGVGGEETE